MDGIGQTLEYIRNPLKTKLMEKNLAKLDEVGLEKLNFRAMDCIYNRCDECLSFYRLLKWKIEQDFAIISPVKKQSKAIY